MNRILPLLLLLGACATQPADSSDPAAAAEEKAEVPTPSTPTPSTPSDASTPSTPSNPSPRVTPTPSVSPVAPSDPSAESCDASRANGLIGQMQTEELGEQALRLTGARTLRWITPGMAVTMDYSPSRLNIRLDGGRRVTGFDCG